MSLQSDLRSLGLGPNESASVTYEQGRLHNSPGIGQHFDAYLVRPGFRPDKFHVTDPDQWEPWGPWDACQPDFK